MDGSTSINSHMHVTVGQTESGQHKHMQVVNRGYLLASNEAHASDRVATQKRPLKPRVTLSTKPREEQGEDYDSEYSEIAITTEVQESLGISIHQNVAYDLDEDDIATVNSTLRATVVGSHVKMGGVPPQVKKKPPVVKTKPKRMTSSSSSSFEALASYDIPKSKPLSIDDSTAIYDMVKSEYGGELEDTSATDIPQRQFHEPQYSNTSCSYQGSVQDKQELYYNHRELMRQTEVLYGNLKEEANEAFYGNLNQRSGADKVSYGNLNKGSGAEEVSYGNLNKDTEEAEYYNQRDIMMGGHF